MTLTLPVPADEVAVIWLALLTAKDAAAVPPNLTAVAPVKFVPVMVTLVPPAGGPALGLTLVTVGADRKAELVGAAWCAGATRGGHRNINSPGPSR